MKLNFGCGSIQPEGWVNLDHDEVFSAPVRELGSLVSDTFDIAVAHCALQTNPHEEFPGVLKELHRVLKPGGVLRVSLPDIVTGFRAYTYRLKDWFPNSEADVDDLFSNWLTWYSTTRVLLTPTALMHRLIEAGFAHATRVEFGNSHVSHDSTALDDREGEVYFVEATK